MHSFLDQDEIYSYIPTVDEGPHSHLPPNLFFLGRFAALYCSSKEETDMNAAFIFSVQLLKQLLKMMMIFITATED